MLNNILFFLISNWSGCIFIRQSLLPGCVIFAGSLLTMGWQHAEASQLTALQCGTLLDVQKRVVQKNMTILIEEDRILSVEKKAIPPADAKIVDLSDKTCLPGLMDMHVHTMMYDGKTRRTGPTETSATLTLIGMRNVNKMLQNGFTTLRIPGDGDPAYGIIDLRNAINEGIVQGPRLFVAPHLLQPIWGQFHWTTENDVNDLVPAGANAARDAVRREFRHGADFIKIAVDEGGVSKDSITRMFTDEELRAFVDEAHRLNKRITVCAHGAEATHAAVVLGYDSIEHGFFMAEETAREMVNRGTWYVPTLTIFDAYYDDKLDQSRFSIDVPQRRIDWRERRQKRDVAFKTAYEMGVKIAYGTDRLSPLMASREFSYLVRLGVSNWDAIAMATVNGAELLGVTNDLGSITAGKFADIIATSQNPLDDIENIEDVRFVMKAGTIVRQNQDQLSTVSSRI